MKVCPVCSDLRPTTKEDIIPKWARKVYKDLGSWPGGVPSELMLMCSPCNKRLGQRFENYAAPLMSPMLRGEPVVLSAADQGFIAGWLAKTTLLSWLRSNHPVDQLELIRAAVRSVIDRRVPPGASFVRIGLVDPADWAGPPHEHAWEPGPLPPVFLFSVSSLVSLTWELVIGDPDVIDPFIIATPDSDWNVRIWPPQIGGISWPPPNRHSFADMADRRAAYEAMEHPPPKTWERHEGTDHPWTT